MTRMRNVAKVKTELTKAGSSRKKISPTHFWTFLNFGQSGVYEIRSNSEINELLGEEVIIQTLE